MSGTVGGKEEGLACGGYAEREGSPLERSASSDDSRLFPCRQGYVYGGIPIGSLSAGVSNRCQDPDCKLVGSYETTDTEEST